ncbi:hypothetical protein PG988_015348 [Apiospora saccharicola]
MADETNHADLSNAEKGMCAPTPASPGDPDTKPNTTTLIDLGNAEIDHESAAAEFQAVEETALPVEKLQSLRQKQLHVVEDWLVEIQAILLKILPPSHHLDSDAILQLKTWLLDKLDSAGHRCDDFQAQMNIRLSKALKTSGKVLEPGTWPHLLVDILVNTMSISTATYVLYIAVFRSGKFYWYDSIIQAVGYLPMYIWMLSQCEDRTSWFFTGLLVVTVLFAVFISSMITLNIWVHFGLGSS